jgi:NAD+ synthase (glutamine-hydrolysing)
MFDYFRVACAVPDVEVADVDFNVTQMKKFISDAKNEKVDLLVFPELGITGYSCCDLFFQQTLLSSAKTGIKSLIGKCGNTIVAAGAPLEIDGSIYNCAVIIANGKVKEDGTKEKVLPNILANSACQALTEKEKVN